MAEAEVSIEGDIKMLSVVLEYDQQDFVWQTEKTGGSAQEERPESLFVGWSWLPARKSVRYPASNTVATHALVASGAAIDSEGYCDFMR
jgi:hypothetical protein